MSLIRTYLAFCGNITKEEAGKEIEKHLISGGKFTDVVEAMSEQMQDSGFFRAIGETREAEDAETSTQNPKSKKE